MPYIKLEVRPKFASHVHNALSLMTGTNDSQYVIGEYFGFFVNRLCKLFLGDPDYGRNTFNSAFFVQDKKKALQNASDSIATALTRSQPLESAGDLNYSITALYWGLLGESADLTSARYGMRAYLTGILDKIYESIDSVNTGSQRDVTMGFRRHIIIRGVLLDVIHEARTQLHDPYEDLKRAENGNIWEDGKLVVPKEGE